jgi:ATP-dependent helicase/nuclease subunit A
MSPEGKPTFPDLADRLAIVDELSRNFLVEAAAGTGKTTSLVDRLVALLAKGETTIEHVAAVTFTIKAAAELGERLQLALERRRRDEPDPAVRTRLRAALEGREKGFVGTIHAFCARLIRERPVEAGVDPGFEELDELENLVLRGEAWKIWTDRVFLERSPILGPLAEVGLPLASLKQTYELLADNRDVVAAPSPPVAQPDLSRARTAVCEFLDRAVPHVPMPALAGGRDRFQEKLLAAAHLRTLEGPAVTVKLLSQLESRPNSTLKTWRDRGIAKLLSEEYEELRNVHVLPALARWREYVYPIAIETVGPALAEFDRLRAERGKLNFQDLLIRARDLLRDRSEVRAALQERYTHLLVDEFQDTDPIQTEVMLYLTGGDVREKDWRELVPRPGSLFVVGDPKQSIYRFRRADIETYDRVRRRIEQSGGRLAILTTNFRSTGRICDWLNTVFESVLPATSDRMQAAHAPLHAAFPAGDEASGAFRLSISGRAESIESEDAQRIAEWISRAIARRRPVVVPDGKRGLTTRPLEAGDFLVLLRRRRNLDVYARALEARGVPYEITGGGAFCDSEELAALLPLLEALADPDDPVLLTAALRQVFGVDDDALFRFKRDDGRFSFLVQPPPSADARIRAALERLRAFHESTRRLPPAAAIAGICRDLGWIVYAAAREMGGTRAGNLLKALAVARRLSADGEPFSGVVERLRDLASADKVEEMSTEPGRARAVRVMNLHQAKGLEAPVVFLADPTREKEWDIDQSIDRTTEPALAYFRIVEKGKKWARRVVAQPVGWEEREATEKSFEEAERDRLLYVAATRAKSVLVVSECDKPGTWSKLSKFLQTDLPELPRSPVPDAAASLRTVARDVAAFRGIREDRRARCLEPSYATVTATAIAHASAPLPGWELTGRGMSWGRVIHRLLEGLMRSPSLDVRAYARNLLAEEERPATDLEEVVAVVEGVRSSALWRRALSARRQLVEVPFAVEVESSEIGKTAGPARTLLQGAIDLAFEEDSGWFIVDYKSDTIVDNLDELVAYYLPQIELYRSYWEKLTGRPTKAGLYFVSTGQEVWPADA